MPRRESIGVVNVLGDALFGRRTSFGLGSDIFGDITGASGGSMMARRGSMDSVVDAAIQNLANRRLSMLGGTTHAAMNANAMNNTISPTGGVGLPHLGINHSMMGSGLGIMGMQSQGLNGIGSSMGINMNTNGTIGMASQMNQFLMNGLGLNSMTSGSNHQVTNTDVISSQSSCPAPNSNVDSERQKELQDRQIELQRRQKELEFQRQQLLTAMEERKQAMQQMQHKIPQGVRQQHRQAERRYSLFDGALAGFGSPLPGAASSSVQQEHSSKAILSGSTERRGSGIDHGSNFLSVSSAARVELENKWRRNNGMRDERRGSLDLLGALAGVTQEAEESNNLMNKNKNIESLQLDTTTIPTCKSSSSDQMINAKATESFSLIKKPIPLGLPADKDWLTPLHCFVRLHCVEVFTATKVDVAIPTKGKRKPIRIGQVGIRCPHCHNSETGLVSRERGSVYYPTSVSSIYNATMNLLQRHLHNCTSVQPEIMKRYETLKSDDARSGTSKKYWAESALSLGLVDTSEGIRFSNLEPPPLPSLTSEQKASDNYSASRGNNDSFFNSASNAFTSINGTKSDGHDFSKNALEQKNKIGGKRTKDGVIHGENAYSNIPSDTGDKRAMQDAEKSLAISPPLVVPDDEKVATQFSFYLLGQMQMCVFTEADRLGKRKGLPPGFPGLACRHCFGGYGSGRFFPSSIKTLSDTSKTLNVLFNHMRRCRKCPSEVRETLEKLRKLHDEQRAKMKFGSQKAFFARIWDRLHDNDPHVDSRKRKFFQPKKPKSKPSSPAPVPNTTATENFMNMHLGRSHMSQHSHHAYLNASNAFVGSMGGLSTAGLLNGFGASGVHPTNNGFTPSSAQYVSGETEANKRLKLQNLTRSNLM
eukprot:CAMPEP_0197197520 /NCGR_PEP_ID=MMETSP1423-20130617/32910_1 /TAXON_ID=476441 /ORGANISM="Pseudo-nitzschia heimii, Strain UNC1101" /LENGTH=874 /DNA_ID=CAMNT_0042651345 /DNA_START=180 /DNA_END=2804 /DNA_ORIENTATION=+